MDDGRAALCTCLDQGRKETCHVTSAWWWVCMCYKCYNNGIISLVGNRSLPPYTRTHTHTHTPKKKRRDNYFKVLSNHSFVHWSISAKKKRRKEASRHGMTKKNQRQKTDICTRKSPARTKSHKPRWSGAHSARLHIISSRRSYLLSRRGWVSMQKQEREKTPGVVVVYFVQDGVEQKGEERNRTREMT